MRAQSPFTIAAAVILAGFLGIAILETVIAPYDPTAAVGSVWEPPSDMYRLGTDSIGRDMFSRIVWGAQITFLVAIAATLLAFLIGGTLGFIAAVRGGWVDQVLSRLNDLLMAIPTLILALVVLAVLPKTITVLILVVATLESTRVFRVSRSIASEIAVMDFVEVARARGEGWTYIIVQEMLPNALSPLLAELGLRFAFSVLFLSSLSFLGLGIQPPLADWGMLVKENKDGLMFGIATALIPGAAISLLAISVNLVVDGLINHTSRLKRRSA